MAYYDDLTTDAQALRDKLEAKVNETESPVVQELVNARDHVDAVLTRLTNVKELEEAPETPADEEA